jgi:hypothetical protein
MEKLELIKKEIERRIDWQKQFTDALDSQVSASAYHKKYELENLLSFIDSLEDEPKKVYDPDYLQSCIDKAKKSWEGVDVHKYMDEVRGREKSEIPTNLEEEIDRLWEGFAEEMEGPHNLFDVYRRCARHFAEWQKKQDQETIELAEDHAMMAGRMQMKEEMMKEAVDGIVGFVTIRLCTPNFGEKYKEGDRVKLIVIPKDNETRDS